MLDRHTLSFVAPAVGASATASVTATLAEGDASRLSATLEIEVAPPATPDPAVEYPPASSVGLFVNQDIAKASNRDDFETSAVEASGWTRGSQGTSAQRSEEDTPELQ